MEQQAALQAQTLAQERAQAEGVGAAYTKYVLSLIHICFAQRNAAPDFARQTQKAGPVTGQRGFAAGEMEAEADKCPQHAAGREDGGRGAAL